jgi:hypothetical protein
VPLPQLKRFPGWKGQKTERFDACGGATRLLRLLESQENEPRWAGMKCARTSQFRSRRL